MKFRSIKNLFSRKKYATSIYDLSNENTPLDLIYSNFQGKAALVPLERCRSHMLGFTVKENPFIETLKTYSKSKGGYAGSLLEDYYNNFCPNSMRIVLNSDDSSLNKYHPMATVMPWGIATPEQKLPKVCVDPNATKLFSSEAKKLGLSEKDNYGWQFFGPVSKDLGLLEYQRLTSVFNSIKDSGYLPEQHGFIHGQFLVSDNNWVWINIGGKHRFASLAALNFTNIPVALNSRSSALFIRRIDVDYWPNVKNGLFSRTDALNIFDRLMSGNIHTPLRSNK